MERRNNLAKNIIGIAVSTGLALMTQGKEGVAIEVVNSIAGNIASSFIEKAEYKKFQNLLKETDPGDLNHDLKKLIVKALEWAIKNIEFLYKKELQDPQQLKTLKAFNKDLLQEIKVLNAQLLETKDDIYEVIEQPKSEEELFKVFDLNLADFPVIQPNRPYPAYFKEHFLHNLQLCFGELLKNEKNRPAYIAYQRAIYQKLDGGIQTIIQQNEDLIKKLEASPQAARHQENKQQWTQVQAALGQVDLQAISPAFEQVFNSQVQNLQQQTTLLVDSNGVLQEELAKVKGISKNFSRQLEQNWLQKNKVGVAIGFLIAALIIAGLYYQLNQVPFSINATISTAPDVRVHPEYPPLSKEASIRFYLAGEAKETDVNSSREVLLNNLPAGLKNQTCKVELLDPYWTLNADSIALHSGSIHLLIQPNDKLAELTGRVLSRNGQEVLKGAKVSVGNHVAMTNENGLFSIQLPISDRKIKHILRVEKEQYMAKEIEYIAGSAIEIRLIAE